MRLLALLAVLAVSPSMAGAVERGPRVSTVARGLEIPWEIAFLPGGRALVTERPGRVRLLGRDGQLRRAPVARVPVTALGEGGLLGLAVDPRFAANRRVYLYFTTASGMRLERRRWTGSQLVRDSDARRRHPRRAGPRLRAHRLWSRRAALRQHGRRGRRTTRPGPGVAQRQAARAHAAAVPRQRDGAPHDRRHGPAQHAGLRLAARQPPADRDRARAHRVRRPRGLREVNALVPGGNYGGPSYSAPTPAAASSHRRCASTETPSRRRAQRS